MSDRRKHVRVEHDVQVEISGGTGVIPGRSVDLSRTGMSIVVRIPESFSDVQSITFRLPRSGEQLKIPCRVIRNGQGADRATFSDQAEDDRVLALAFDREAEAQMLLIENYIRERKAHSGGRGLRGSEARQIPRIACAIEEVVAVGSDLELLSIDNISTEGFLFSYRRGGSLSPASRLKVRFRLPRDPREIVVEGEVVYVVEDGIDGQHAAGFKFDGLREAYRARIQSYIVAAASRSSIQALHRRLDGSGRAFRLVDPDEIGLLFRRVLAARAPIQTILGESYDIIELHAASLGPEFEGRLEVAAEAPLLPGAVSCSFSLGPGTYYFQSVISQAGGAFYLDLPTRVHRSEKRSYGRKDVDSRLVLKLIGGEGGGGAEIELHGRIVDISRRGFLAEVTLPEGAAGSAGSSPVEGQLRPGIPVRYRVDDRLALGTMGEIRHLKSVARSNRRSVVRIGIEAGIARGECRFSSYEAAEWEARKRESGIHGTESARDHARIEWKVVRIENSAGQEIAAIACATRWHVPATVIILPPAFGKKKETLAPLAAVLVSNFRAAGREAVVVRYDGINRPGESYKAGGARRRGYEMLDYEVSQGQSDMQAVLDYVYNNPYFVPERVCLVTFSMSALDGRKLLLDERNRDRIGHWVSVMGLPSAQRTLINLLGGLDILANYRMGIPNGVLGMLGHLVDMDRLAEDLIRGMHAYLTDARFDMARIGQPVTWIYGTFDKWVDSTEVRDVMSIDSPGAREVVEIPTGHNLHTSDDALLSFRLVTSAIFRQLFGDHRDPIGPDMAEMFELIADERERLARADVAEMDDYWREYLIGKAGDSEGYDFYRNIKEFHSFLRREAELLGGQPGERIADMGCGTGLFLESMLERLGEAWSDHGSLHITAVDLVPEALEKARAKATGVLSARPSLSGVQIDYIVRNLEPNRLLPVRRFLEADGVDLRHLKDRIEGLRRETYDRIQSNLAPDLARILRGGIPREADSGFLERALGAEAARVVLELNRAARYVLRRLSTADLRVPRDGEGPDVVLGDRDYGSLTASALRFDTLRFGDAALDSGLGFPPESFERIAASLFVSYLFNPHEIFPEFYRLLSPGGTLLVSTMKPDSDISVIFTDFVSETQAEDGMRKTAESRLSGARSMLNEAASLFELAEEGFFSFFTGEQLADLLHSAGFEGVAVEPALGSPPQAFIAVGKKPR